MKAFREDQLELVSMEERKNKKKDYTAMFFGDAEDLTPSQQLDAQLKEEDSSNDGQEYVRSSSSSSFDLDPSPPPVKKVRRRLLRLKTRI